MGCQTCKIGRENQQQLFFTDNKFNKKHQEGGLLTSNDKQIWLDNLAEPNQPDDNFFATATHTTHSCFTQIKKDIVRSFSTCQFFYQKANIQRFETLLKKFALYFPKVGYTQGINFLAGYLLIAGFDDQDAFKILVRIVLHEKLLMIGLYQDKFPLNRLYCAIFWKLLDKRQPNTALKIKLANVLDQIWIFQWFMTFFLYSFPVEFVKKFFDYIICKKQFAMVCLALGIINCLKTDINNLENLDQFQFFEYLDKLKNTDVCESKINIEKVINYANSITKHEITKALEEIKLSKNIYYTYFRRQSERSQIWRQLNEKLTYERRMFQFDPKSSQYTRDLNSVEHLQRLLLKKSKLYRSKTDSKYSSQIRTSNFTVDLDQAQQYMSEREHQKNPLNFIQNNQFSNQLGGYQEDWQNRTAFLKQQQQHHQQTQMQIAERNLGMKRKNQIALMRATTRDDSSVSRDSRNKAAKNNEKIQYDFYFELL